MTTGQAARQDAFDRAQDTFKTILGARLSKGMTFLRRDRAAHILEDELPTSILGPIIPVTSDLEKGRLTSRVLQTPELAIILTIILFSGDFAMITDFKHNLLRSSTQVCETPGKALPLSCDESRLIFGHENGDKFFDLQARHLGIDLYENKFCQEIDDSRCLPYLEEWPINPRSYVKIWKVYVYLARKDFAPSEGPYKSFQKENRILEEFSQSSDCPSSIMTSVCSVIYKLPGYRDRSTPAASIFFHLADQNLEDYMTSDSRPNPKDDLERLCILRQMLALSQGLQWLNQERQQYGSGRAYCHNDLKPQNILVFGNPDHPETLRFKITDFGEACQPQPQQGGPDPFERPGT
ncbi:hypothetical protein GGS24DRAFT_507487 [Hypoxylon argillaceum]|nr:hypothetical protein GGS24DRAFT_507487 [Hypoxylon argillaceum]